VLHRIIEVAPTFRTSKENLDKLFSTKDDKSSGVFASQLDEEFIINNSFISCEFEKIIDTKETTNFDFYVQQKNGNKVLFEIKYTEKEFGRAVADENHINKYNNIYRSKLEKLLRPEFLNEDFVFENYQIIRNLSYIDDLTTIVFMFPEANQELRGTEDLIRQILLPEFVQQTRVVYIENLTLQILKSNYLKQLHPIFETFKQIYID
jgi:hypothetical protein